MPTFRQICRPCLRAVGNRLRFPRVRIGASSYVSRGSRVTADSSLGRECRVFAAHLGCDSHLGDEVVVGHDARVVSSTLGARCIIEEHAELYHCTLAAHVGVQPRCNLSDVRIGRYSYIAREAWLAGVTIGSFASIGPRTLLGCGDHPANLVSTAPVFFSTRRQCGASFATTDAAVERRPITLGHDVWIGAQVFVRDGVSIGDGAIVAAGAVVTADVPPYAIVGGVPAKLIRYRFPADAIRRLQAVQWWRWDETRLHSAQPWFVEPDIHAFLLHAET
jgi:acetyltransferase-like isoleucine patch superfamily enzyme